MTKLRLETSRFGTVEVEEGLVLTFVSPILGFETHKRFVVLDHSDNSPFKWLQSVDDPALAFVITNPKFFAIPYEFMLPDEASEKLEAKQAEDLLVFTIVNIPSEQPALMTANLLAPVVVNQKNLYTMQVVLQNSEFSTRTRLLPDSALSGAGGAASVSEGKG